MFGPADVRVELKSMGMHTQRGKTAQCSENMDTPWFLYVGR
jgi:hypothetical protein